MKCLDRLPELNVLQLIVEIARRESSDAIYYNCDNPDLEDYISNKGFKTDYETFSDILVVAPASGIAAVNLSSGLQYVSVTRIHKPRRVGSNDKQGERNRRGINASRFSQIQIYGRLQILGAARILTSRNSCRASTNKFTASYWNVTQKKSQSICAECTEVKL